MNAKEAVELIGNKGENLNKLSLTQLFDIMNTFHDDMNYSEYYSNVLKYVNSNQNVIAEKVQADKSFKIGLNKFLSTTPNSFEDVSFYLDVAKSFAVDSKVVADLEENSEAMLNARMQANRPFSYSEVEGATELLDKLYTPEYHAKNECVKILLSQKKDYEVSENLINLARNDAKTLEDNIKAVNAVIAKFEKFEKENPMLASVEVNASANDWDNKGHWLPSDKYRKEVNDFLNDVTFRQIASEPKFSKMSEKEQVKVMSEAKSNNTKSFINKLATNQKNVGKPQEKAGDKKVVVDKEVALATLLDSINDEVSHSKTVAIKTGVKDFYNKAKQRKTKFLKDHKKMLGVLAVVGMSFVTMAMTTKPAVAYANDSIRQDNVVRMDAIKSSIDVNKEYRLKNYELIEKQSYKRGVLLSGKNSESWQVKKARFDNTLKRFDSKNFEATDSRHQHALDLQKLVEATGMSPAQIANLEQFEKQQFGKEFYAQNLSIKITRSDGTEFVTDRNSVGRIIQNNCDGLTLEEQVKVLEAAVSHYNFENKGNVVVNGWQGINRRGYFIPGQDCGDDGKVLIDRGTVGKTIHYEQVVRQETPVIENRVVEVPVQAPVVAKQVATPAPVVEAPAPVVESEYEEVTFKGTITNKKGVMGDGKGMTALDKRAEKGLVGEEYHGKDAPKILNDRRLEYDAIVQDMLAKDELVPFAVEKTMPQGSEYKKLRKQAIQNYEHVAAPVDLRTGKVSYEELAPENEGTRYFVKKGSDFHKYIEKNTKSEAVRQALKGGMSY